MSKERSLAAIVALVCAIPVHADGAEDHLALFASCTGRLSAEVEHLWLMSDRMADAMEDARDKLSDLVESVAYDHDDSVRAMDLRLSSKVAHAALLRRAEFSSERDSADWAKQRAHSLSRACMALVLDVPEAINNVQQADVEQRVKLN